MTQLETLQSLFKNRAFVIPDYQRGYAWENEHRTDLLNDIVDLGGLGRDKVHYTGTVVLHRGAHECKTISGTTYDVVDVVDGQQRLTTLIVLISCITEVMIELRDDDSTETAVSLKNEYVERRSKQDRLSRLRLNGNLDLFFRDCIVGNGNIGDLTIQSRINLLNAKSQFTSYISMQISAHKTPVERVKYLEELTHRITNRLGFVVYEVDDEAEVGVMFEVMNARGRPLTEMEKVKNYLLYIGSRVSESPEALKALAKDVNETWAAVLDTIAAAGSSAREDQFLRYHWAIYPGAGWYQETSRSRTFEIHRAVKNTINMRLRGRDENYNAVLGYLRSARTLVISYRDAFNPTHPLAFPAIGAGRQDVIDRATSLQRIGRTATVLPVMMAAHYVFGTDSAALTEVFRLCETLAFRLAAVEKNANTGDSYAYGIAANIMNGTHDLRATVEKLKECIEYYCSDFSLRAALTDPTKDFYQWGPLKYFLFEYERRLVELSSSKFTQDWTLFFKKSQSDTVEHILPQGENTLAVPYWGSIFEPDTHQAHMNRLGNLSLTDWNSFYSNKPFPDKAGSPEQDMDAKTYRNSRWRMERELASNVDWTPLAIVARQEKLAAFALERWRI